jgi:hypothetical protein
VALIVVLDANVLYPIALTDFFMTLAGYGLYLPHWSSEILDEVARNLLRNQPELTKAQLAYRFAQMARAHPGALVDPPGALVSAMTNDRKDRHVLAAAIASGAPVIATFNTKHFQYEALRAGVLPALRGRSPAPRRGGRPPGHPRSAGRGTRHRGHVRSHHTTPSHDGGDRGTLAPRPAHGDAAPHIARQCAPPRGGRPPGSDHSMTPALRPRA